MNKTRAKVTPLPKMTREEKVQAIYRQYSQKFAVYMEAAVFNLLGNAKALEIWDYEDIIKEGADIAEKMIDAVPEAINAAFERRVQKMAEKAAAEAEKEGKE